MRVCERVRCVGVAGAAVLGFGVSAQPVLLDDGFETYGVGSLPGAPWADVTSRIDSPTVPSPSASVISTTDAFGNSTRALQTVDAIGTSSGVLAEFAPVAASSLRVDVRIEQFTNVVQGATWSAGVGFLQDSAADDLNFGPQVVVYASLGVPTYRVYVLNGGRVTDFAIPGAPIELDRWVTVGLTLDSVAGTVDASVTDPVTGQVLGQAGRTIPFWSQADGQFDAIALFDGEYNAVGGTLGGIATYDNVVHTVVPAPGGAGVVGSLALLMRRRRD